MRTGLKTFLIKAADQKRLAYAKRMIERGLSKSVTIKVEVPITTLGTIIGPKGATLKAITDSTQCKIDIPRRDTLPTYDPKEQGSDAGSDDEDDEPQVEITVTGPSVACQDAKTKILGLISSKVSQGSSSIKTIPSNYYPFIAGPRGVKAKELEETVGAGLVKVHVPPPAVWKAMEKQASGEDEGAALSDRDLSIKVKGDKEKVKAVVAHIQHQYEELSSTLREFGISLPKRQHRFLVGAAADEILEQTGCIVDLPAVSNPSEQIFIRGPHSSLMPALTLIMDKANAISVETVDVVALHRGIPDANTHAAHVLRYLTRASKLRAIADANPGVKVFPPFAAVVASTGNVVIEIVGDDKAAVAKAREAVTAVVKNVLPAGVGAVEIDPMVHALLIGKKGAKIATFEQSNNVTTVFPPAAEESSEVLLVYTGALDSLPSEKKARDAKLKEAVTAASKALEQLAKDAADIKSETLDIEKKWHRYIIGQGGTVLNALIGEDNLVQVKVGAGSAKSGAKATAGSDDEDIVVVRGPSTEVDRVVEQLKKIVEDAKNDDIINGYTVEFNVDKKHVAHLVGSAGAAINKLKEALGVKVQFDDGDEKSKKPKVVCKIVGRKESVEEAKRRLDAQIEKLEDETTEIITIKRAIQPALIGAGGKYAIRLEEKYGVKLSFPRDGKDTPNQKPDEVVIRGGKKGVAAVKAELLEAAQFESENRQEISFTVPAKSIANIVGKGGSTINGIKDEHGAQIDIDKESTGDKTNITVRGDKKAIAAAKAAILAIVETIGDEINVTLNIDQKYHRNLIGQGGSKLRETITSVGGPSEGFKQSGLVTFPKPADASSPHEVRLRGESKLIKAIQAELEKQVKTLKETKVIGVVVPASQHASKIGRGGSALQDLQRKSGAQVHFPGSRQYSSIGEIENASDLGEADAAEIVKLVGLQEAVDKAAELLSVSTERAPRENRGGRGPSDQPSRTVSVANKYYHFIVDQPTLIRSIRSAGGSVTFPSPAPAKNVFARPVSDGATSLAAKAARIDLDGNGEESDVLPEGEWELRDNYEGAQEGEGEWTIRARSEEDLDKVEKVLQEAIDKAKAATHGKCLTPVVSGTIVDKEN
jgi:predicted PilT family ATPase